MVVMDGEGGAQVVDVGGGCGCHGVVRGGGGGGGGWWCEGRSGGVEGHEMGVVVRC